MVRNKVISYGHIINEIFGDRVEEWIVNIGLQFHSKPHMIKYFKDGLIQNINLRDESLSS